MGEQVDGDLLGPTVPLKLGPIDPCWLGLQAPRTLRSMASHHMQELRLYLECNISHFLTHTGCLNTRVTAETW